LLPALKRLLNEELRQWRAFKDQARAGQYRGGTATNQARMAWTLQYQNAFIAIKDPATSVLVSHYLPDPDFGQCAAIVLAEQWRAANDRSDPTRFRFGVDFSYVDQRRAARETRPDATSPEAETIFSVIDKLLVDGGSDEQKKHAVALGIIAARLPHGQRNATIERLLALAPRRSRATLAQSLILSGEVVDVTIVRNGIAEVLEAAETQSWILQQDGYQLREWLQLLPFTNRPEETPEIVRQLPAQQREPMFLEEMIAAFDAAPSAKSEDALFKLAETDPRLYGNHTWRRSILQRNSSSAARRFMDLVIGGELTGRGSDSWQITRQLGALIDDYPELREHAYNLLMSGLKSPGLAQLSRAVAENPDDDGLILLVQIDPGQTHSLVTWRTVEKVITRHIPDEGWSNAYNIVPVQASALRHRLLALTADARMKDAAASCLNLIDSIRDSIGSAESDPRHPNIASGRAWPMIAPAAPQGDHRHGGFLIG
jgi:hypothetical protein